VLPLLQAGKIRIIGVASKARLGGVAANIPTFREQGIDVVFDVPRGVIGPKGLTPQQVRYWESVFQALVKTDEWRQALDKNQWVEDFQTSAQMGKELKAQYEILKDVLSELGMVGAKP
jgi:putative tricarboxylic transport membrane protein